MSERDAQKTAGTVPVTQEAEPKRSRFSFMRFPKSWAEVKRLGWKFIVAFILFYLIRDLILYVILPYFIYKGVSTH